MKCYAKALSASICCFFGFTDRVEASLPDSTVNRQIMHVAEQLAKRHIGDKRTAVFELAESDTLSNTYRFVTTVPEAAADFDRSLAGRRDLTAQVTVTLLPDSTVMDGVTGVVNLSVANLRVQPSNQAELATQVLLGTVVDVLQKRDGYYRVRTPEGYIAWVSTSSITPMTPAESKRWNAADRVIFVADFGHAYSMPDARALRVSDLVMGNILQAEGVSGGFVQVRYPDSRVAYVHADLVRPFDEWLGATHLEAAPVIQTAKTMMGLPYLWGGTSVKGVDCSGFTKTAFFMNGIVIPRDASQQVLAGQPVEILSADTLDREKALERLQPADLLFFASDSDRPPNARVTHVALYLGNGEFIHAAGTVRINSLLPSAPHYADFQTRTLIAARRYIGQADTALQPVATHPAYTTQTEKHVP